MVFQISKLDLFLKPEVEQSISLHICRHLLSPVFTSNLLVICLRNEKTVLYIEITVDGRLSIVLRDGAGPWFGEVEIRLAGMGAERSSRLPL